MLIAAVQLTSKNDLKKNLSVASALMTRAVRQGAELIALPEYFSFIGTRSELQDVAEPFGKGPAYEMVQEFSEKHKVFVLAGSIPVLPDGAASKSVKSKKTTAPKKAKDFDPELKLINRSVLFDSKGKVLSTYDKIHLFDTELLDSRSYSESQTFLAGKKPVAAETPFGKVGMTVCYDLRFPELFRSLVLQGVRIVFVPSAFTMYTGKDHWIPLLRARAIENQIYIVAPAQYGKHAEHKVSYGKSCIIDPWGNITALAPDCETVILSDIDFKFLTKVRKELPVLKHIRKDLFKF